MKALHVMRDKPGKVVVQVQYDSSDSPPKIGELGTVTLRASDIRRMAIVVGVRTDIDWQTALLETIRAAGIMSSGELLNAMDRKGYGCSWKTWVLRLQLMASEGLIIVGKQGREKTVQLA